MMWSTTRPERDGWYVWREDVEVPPEIVQVWMAQKSRGQRKPPRYGWHVGTWLAKRMHDEEATELDAAGGEFLRDENGPIRIDMPDEEDAIATEDPAPKSRSKSTAKAGVKPKVQSKPPAEV